MLLPIVISAYNILFMHVMIKKLLPALAVTAAINTFSFTANGQVRNVLKVNILSPIFRTVNLSYEHAVSEKTSFQLGAFYSGAGIAGTRFRGFGITPEYRFYFSNTKQAPAGFYAAPFVRYQNFTISDNDLSTSEGTLSTFGGGLVVGHQAIFNERISLDFFLGPSYNAGAVKVSSGTANDLGTGPFSGFGLRFGLTLGLAFK